MTAACGTRGALPRLDTTATGAGAVGWRLQHGRVLLCFWHKPGIDAQQAAV